MPLRAPTSCDSHGAALTSYDICNDPINESLTSKNVFSPFHFGKKDHQKYAIEA